MDTKYINWSNAPADATHFGEDGSGYKYWYRIPSKLGDDYDYIIGEMSNWRSNFGSPRAKELIPRPSSEPEWIKWGGGEMPVKAGTPITVKHRSGSVYGENAGEYYSRHWSHTDCLSDIIAFYVREEEKEEDVVANINNLSNSILDIKKNSEGSIGVTVTDNNKSPSAHYEKYIYRVNLTDDDKENGYVDVKLDPYRVGKVCNVGGGALEQILKKAMRGVDKGHDERQVLNEIISAANRGIEMLDEDQV